jgi:hypothetical protein
MARKISVEMTGFQKLLGTSVLIFALAFAYYLVIYIPSQTKTKQDLETQRQANLQVCLNNASINTNAQWNTDCADRGLKDNCLLPLVLANAVNGGLKDAQDSCYKRYPTP